MQNTYPINTFLYLEDLPKYIENISMYRILNTRTGLEQFGNNGANIRREFNYFVLEQVKEAGEPLDGEFSIVSAEFPNAFVTILVPKNTIVFRIRYEIPENVVLRSIPELKVEVIKIVDDRARLYGNTNYITVDSKLGDVIDEFCKLRNDIDKKSYRIKELPFPNWFDRSILNIRGLSSHKIGTLNLKGVVIVNDVEYRDITYHAQMHGYVYVSHNEKDFWQNLNPKLTLSAEEFVADGDIGLLKMSSEVYIAIPYNKLEEGLSLIGGTKEDIEKFKPLDFEKYSEQCYGLPYYYRGRLFHGSLNFRYILAVDYKLDGSYTKGLFSDVPEIEKLIDKDGVFDYKSLSAFIRKNKLLQKFKYPAVRAFVEALDTD